jgi:hypothetical protein
MKIKPNIKLPKFRKDSLSLKEFQLLSKEEKENYIKEIEELPKEMLGDVDEHIINFYAVKKPEKNNWLEL